MSEAAIHGTSVVEHVAPAAWPGSPGSGPENAGPFRESDAKPRSPFFYRLRPVFHLAVTDARSSLWVMADVLVLVGIIAFVLAMLGLIWGLERI